MSVKNVTVNDLALIELADAGKTGAPPEVLERLRASGHLVLTAAGVKLTSKGSRRAERLKPFEHDMRLMWGAKAGANAGAKAPLTTDGGCGLRIGGGSARISG